MRCALLPPTPDWIKATLTEGHELDRKWQVPKEMVGRRLSQGEAKRLLAKFGWGQTFDLCEIAMVCP